jgi:hypothetical protein
MLFAIGFRQRFHLPTEVGDSPAARQRDSDQRIGLTCDSATHAVRLAARRRRAI